MPLTGRWRCCESRGWDRRWSNVKPRGLWGLREKQPRAEWNGEKIEKESRYPLFIFRLTLLINGVHLSY